jgi:hypothetical protein
MVWAFMRPTRQMVSAAQSAAGNETQPGRPAQAYRAAGGAGFGQQPSVPVGVRSDVTEPYPLARQFDPPRLFAHDACPYRVDYLLPATNGCGASSATIGERSIALIIHVPLEFSNVTGRVIGTGTCWLVFART